jgi:2-polyprenyl-3-methyl-5-hydroxy-6-metoxy-1,4-benzoquinol methylase
MHHISIVQERAQFVDRPQCIGCGGDALETLSQGSFSDDPLRSILAGEAWGEDPLPFIAHEHWCYVRCRACGQAFHRHVLAPDWMERLYARWESQAAMESFAAQHITADERLQRGTHFYTHALRLQQMAAGRSGRTRLLDFGCGHGEFVAAARALGIDAVGIDFAPDRARHGAVTMYSSPEALHAAGADQPPFDAVTLFEVLEHLADPRGTLESLAPLMRPGAVLVLETPDTTGITDLRSYSDYLAIAPLGHINGFTPATLRQIAERAGFRAVHPPPYWVTTSWRQALKSSLRNLIAPLRRATTSQYFVRA